MLATSGDSARGHADLRHINVRFYKALKALLVDARTDEYECQVCAMRWEIDYDPSLDPGYSAFRRAG
jgi:hypothetical protein